MKYHIALFGAAMALALPLTSLPAAAATYSGPSHPDKMMGQHNTRWLGKNVVEGTTKNVDHQNGIVHLTTGGSQLVLHFPPPAVNKLQMQQNVTVEMAFKDESRMNAGKNETGSTSQGMMRPGWVGEHTMLGTVTQVNRSNGVLDLKTAEGALALQFPASSLTEVQKGDRLEVYLALRKS